ncbi:MAG: hypothetical protein BWY42_00388 [Candidatus Omnitrophica bacterium ADurb.Bin277]|nr:MAG: hypothetical protein BWY42_00388 [Candidatus Omnitrophica bacterium ADurb.Bin277]
MKRKNGFALITVLAVLIIVTVGIVTILQSLGSQADMKTKNLQELKAQYLAQAGMQHAIWRCRTSGCASETLRGEEWPIEIVATDIGPGVHRLDISVDYPDL